MVRFLLSGRCLRRLLRAVTTAGLVALLGMSALGREAAEDNASPAPAPPELLLDGGRKLTFERSFSLEREVKPKRGFWTRVVDVIAGEPDFHFLVNPYSIATDSHGRVIVTDPGRRRHSHLRLHGKEIQVSCRARTAARIRCSRRSALRSMRRTIFTSPIRRRARFSCLIPAENSGA